MSKVLYKYDPQTGLLINSFVASVDVRASIDKKVYIIPPNCTDQKPPQVDQSYRVARFNVKSNSWNVVDDYRGCEVYDVETKQSVVWDKLGPLPKEYTFISYDKELINYIEWNGDEWVITANGREQMINDIWDLRKSKREAECSSDIEYQGHMIHVDAVSFNDIMLAAQEALVSGDMTTTKRWVTADNVDVQLNGNDFITIARLFGERRQRLVYESNEAWQQDTERSNEELIEVLKELKGGSDHGRV